jgi:succinate-semialdehyde dehydrogenase/glutarate-semialdehyde dehydrogenase
MAAVEMGKPLREAEAEIEKCAVACDHYAAEAPAMLAPERRVVAAGPAEVRLESLGPVLAIMPWNFPFWQVIRATVPTLALGNVVVLKHAENVPRCAEALVGVVREAELPDGAFANVRVPLEAMTALVADRRIRAVTLTGSVRAGRAVASAAGHALKRSVLELGGSDAFIVLDDADLDAAARTAVAARLGNCGQSCIAAKRWLVQAKVADAFLERVVATMAARRVGNPLDPTTDVGPMARHDLRDALDRQVRATVTAGARVLVGGTIPSGPGAFYAPTVLHGVAAGMPCFDEETFGPVAAVTVVADEAEALGLANASPYGLGASVWTADPVRAERLARGLDVGSVFVNGQVHSDPLLPFGGVKDSGYGRELGAYGIRELANVKTVVGR